MSLINDALKRAAADKSRDAQPSASGPPLQPVETAPAPSSSVLPWAVLLLGVGVIGIAAALWFKGGSQQQIARSNNADATATTTAAAGSPSSLIQSETPAPIIVSSPATSPTSVPETTPNPIQRAAATLQEVAARQQEPNASQPEVATSLSSTVVPPARTLPISQPSPQATPQSAPQTPAVASAPSATPSTPPRLQAIYYRMKSPTVVINGKTLGVGQSIDGVKVMSIQRTSVEVQQNGRYKTLTLPQD